MMISIPEAALQILRKLNETGHEAYLVGGCVRDYILGRKPMDWDITTSAHPELVKNIFPKVIETGIKHGTVTVISDKEQFEVTTYRSDGEYLDHRRPNSVSFVPEIGRDLERRDFTINAVAFHPDRGFADPFGGIPDIESGIIRAVGNPFQRFDEDALRMLRAIRFKAQLGFKIENDTYQAIHQLCGRIQHISMERISVEMNKIVLSSRPEVLYELGTSGLMEHICPKLAEGISSVSEDSIMCIRQIPAVIHLRWAALLMFCHLNTNDIENIALKLKCSNEWRHKIAAIASCYDQVDSDKPYDIKMILKNIGKDLFEDMLSLGLAGINPGRRTISYRLIQESYDEIIRTHQCYSLKQLKISGNDLKNSGVPEGPALGECLNQLLLYVIEHPEKNTREDLLARASLFRCSTDETTRPAY